MNEQSTLNATVFGLLREDILTGRLRPGERLRAETLRQRYDVGGSPVREALMRLESEGFVSLEQNKGFKVSGVSLADLEDLTRTRIEIENIALRWSIAKGGVEWEALLVGALHRLSSVPKRASDGEAGRNSDWLRYHREFHSALVAACDSPTLSSIRDRLFDQAERYVSLAIASQGEFRDDVSEHAALMNAAISRDAETALRLNRAHIERTTEKLKKTSDFKMMDV
ncbi:GntR family transcriptional regulator [Oryzicola mucosus]|uniref:FCD domain-containing protein n=1 Tax=Oryzicola mucosus TaxID=2767425 RepID=A0A8J6PF27_9HYPH|nr:FCD domain-containing protein [Oryzicola mucosus]MBD0413899.1 FCD domain-containing protein [Oryzicola mucosus]